MTATSGPGGSAVGLWCGLFAALIWGTWPVVSKLGVQETLSPFDIAALRFGIAGLLLLPSFLRLGLSDVGWRVAVMLVVSAGVPYTLIMTGGLTLAPAGRASLIAPSCALLFSCLGGWLLLGDRPTLLQAMGAGVSIVGVLVTGWASLWQETNEDALAGQLMFAAGGLLWGIFTVGARRWRVAPLHAATIVSVGSMVVYLPVYFVLHGPGIFATPTPSVLGHAVFQGALSAVVALILHTKAVACLGAARGALFPALVPGVAAVLAYPVLGEAPSAMEVTGVVVVLVGMLAAVADSSATKGEITGPVASESDLSHSGGVTRLT